MLIGSKIDRRSTISSSSIAYSWSNDAVDGVQVCKRSTKLLFQVSCATHLQHTVIEWVTRLMNRPLLDLLHGPSTESIGRSSFGSFVEDGTNPCPRPIRTVLSGLIQTQDFSKGCCWRETANPQHSSSKCLYQLQEGMSQALTLCMGSCSYEAKVIV